MPTNTTEIKGDDLKLEEEIWGFRLYEQKAQEALSEFLYVFSNNRFNLQEPLRTPEFSGPSHLVLRMILFCNPSLETASDWDNWEKSFVKYAQNSYDQFPANWTSGSLKKRFDSFSDFQRAVSLIRASSEQNSSNRKWPFRFLFPWGFNQIYPDVKIRKDSDDALTCSRNRFGHSGEVAWLLASLSDGRHKLKNQLEARFGEATHPMAKLCEKIEEGFENQLGVAFKGGASYLPQYCASNGTIKRRADMLCGDLTALLDLRLRTEDLIDSMSRILGMHLICYQLECAGICALDSRLKAAEKPFFLCEAQHRPPTVVRRESKKVFQQNCELCRQVLLEVFKTRFAIVKSASDPDARCQLFEQHFGSKAANAVFNALRQQNLTNLENDLADALEKKYRKHQGIFHSQMTQSVGLTSDLHTNGYRYFPCDEFLLAVVLATVRAEHMPFDEFLDHLYEKYGLVFNSECAEKAHRAQTFRNDLSANSAHLLKQLRSLALLKHLSDSCDYVINPYYQAH